MAINNCLDAAGNRYGGTVSGLAGDGDIVTDIRGKQGTVRGGCYTYTGKDQDWFCLVRYFPQSDGAIREYVVDCRQLTINSHADGTGLVSGGSALTQLTTLPPTENNWLFGSV
jgi:hypothetical protein